MTLQVGEATLTRSASLDTRTVPNTTSNSSHIGKSESTCSEPADFSLNQTSQNSNNILMDKSNTSRSNHSPVIDKKGGVTQVDFRGVLKKSGSANVNKRPVPSIETDKKEDKLDFRNVLSRSQKGITGTESPVKKSLTPAQSSGKSDIFSPVKRTPGTPLLAGIKNDAPASGKQIDFRSVLKKKQDSDPEKLNTDSERRKDLTVLKKSPESIKTTLGKIENGHSLPKAHNLESRRNVDIEKQDDKTSSLPRQPVERRRRPRFQNELESRTVTSGSQVILEYKVDGLPEPEISWSINDKIIKKSKFFCMSYENHVARLVVEEAFSEDEGEYKCTASNIAGTSYRSCNIHIKEVPQRPIEAVKHDNLIEENEEGNESFTEEEELYSPEISPPKIYDISPAKFSILRGGSIEFRASFSAVPKAEVTWLQNKRPISNADNRMRVDTSEHFSTLVISEVQTEDSGRYYVQVQNEIGKDMASASLTVQDIPNAPLGQPTVSDVTKTSVNLSWSGPAYDGGCPITNYRVEYCDAEDQIWTSATTSCQTTTCHIDQLNPNTPYFFRVFAENRHGISTPSQTPEVTVTSEKLPNMLRTLSIESDDEIPFEHREVTMTPGRLFEESYECLEEVGKGKFGSVFRCREKTTDKIWAAKIIKCREADKTKLRIEVEIMNRLKHPKILMLWDVFEVPRKMILIMEFIGGGELFERVLDDDFELTEHDCIQFMRQICDAVSYMHSQNILHLDLKPENILCIKNESNKIKIIDFGLARFYKPGESTRVLFGTPEFIAPEVVNYEEIGYQTDMWSLGVVCYVLLSGISPFMGDSDAETLSNVTMGEFDFEDEGFENISDNAKDFINKLLMKNKKKRMTADECIKHRWLAQMTARTNSRKINTKNLKRFMARRKWQKTGTAIRALGRMGRMSSLQRLYDNSSSSSSSSSSLTPLTSELSSVTSQRSTTTVTSDSVSRVKDFAIEESETNRGISNLTTDYNSITPTSNGRKTDINSNTKQPQSLNQNLPIDTQQLTHEIKPKLKSSNQNGEHLKSTNQKFSENPAEDKSIHDKIPGNHQFDESIKGSPSFTKEMIDSKAFPGDSVRFDVITIGEPEPEIEWYFEDELISPDNLHHMIIVGDDGKNSLIIKDVTEDDDGVYSCSAINSHGEAECSAELIVYGAI